MPILERVEGRRFLDNLFEAPLRRRWGVAANQQRDLADVGNIFEQIDKPHLADKSRYADQHEVPVRQALTHGEPLHSRSLSEERDWLASRSSGTSRRLHRAFELLGFFRPAKLRQKFLTRDTAVRVAAGDPCQRSAWTHDGIEQPPGRFSVAKFQTEKRPGGCSIP